MVGSMQTTLQQTSPPLQAKDGHSVAMTSGNTLRFRPDGSRVEIVTKGQVNPFGACHDVGGLVYCRLP